MRRTYHRYTAAYALSRFPPRSAPLLPHPLVAPASCGLQPLPSGVPLYRFSRQIFIEIKDAVDPSPDTISAPEARRRILAACESTIERLARDSRYFPKPARSLFQEIRYYFPITEQARVYYTVERYIGLAQDFIRDEIERHGEGVVAPCRATTRKGKPCQRTPLPGREYCPSHSHLEEVVLSA